MTGNGGVEIKITADGKQAVSEITAVGNSLGGVEAGARKAGEGLGQLGPAAGTSGKAAAASLEAMGMSAKATAAALRNVPAQFTDIVTSLQSGQAPLTVLMQQGGQLKDMFGGVGPAVKALGGYVASLVTPLSASLAAAGALAVALVKGAEESSQFTRALILSGNAAGTSTGKLQDMAVAIANTTSATQGAAADALAQLAGSGKVAEGNLKGAAEAALALERATGQSIAESVKQFAELGKAPVEASIKLNEQYGYLTAAVFRQIQAAAEMGKTDEAAAIAQRAYADAMSERGGKIAESLGLMEKVWNTLGSAAKGAWDLMLNVGREDSLETQLKKAQDQLQNGFTWWNTIAGTAQKVDYLKGQVAAAKAAADATAAKADHEKKVVDWLKEGDKYLSNEQKLSQEIARIRAQGAAAGVSEKDIEARVAAAREKAPKAAKPPVDPLDSVIAGARTEALAQEVGLSAGTVKEIESLGQALARGKVSAAEYGRLLDAVLNKDEVLKREQATIGKSDALVADYRRANAETLARIRNEADLALMNERSRTIAQALYKVEDEGAKIRDRILRDLPEGAAQTRALAAAEAELAAQKERVTAATAASYDAQHSFAFGWDKAFRDYTDSASNAAKTAQGAFQGMTSAMEGAIKSFVKSGKLDFRSFGDAVINTLIDIQMQSLRTSVLAPMMSSAGALLSGLFGAGAPAASSGGATPGVDFLGGGITIPGRASGGPVTAGSLYEVNERGPELLLAGGRTFLMMGAQGGSVIPAADGKLGVSASGGTSVVINITEAPNSSRAGEAQVRENNGQTIIDIVVAKVRADMVDDARRNGPVTQAMGNTFGLSRRAF